MNIDHAANAGGPQCVLSNHDDPPTLVRPVKFLKSGNYILARTCKAFAFQFVIKSYELAGISDDMQRTTLVTQE